MRVVFVCELNEDNDGLKYQAINAQDEQCKITYGKS